MQVAETDLDAMFAGYDIASFGGNDINCHFFKGTDGAVIYNVEIEAVKPSFNCKTSDVESLSPRATVTINGTDYTVERKQSIGNGTSTVYLKT